jgi:CheY-like chemotaxis protein
MRGRQLQSHWVSAGRYIPMIFVTTSADRKARELALASGALCLLDRPSGYAALLEAIRLLKTLGPVDMIGTRHSFPRRNGKCHSIPSTFKLQKTKLGRINKFSD